MVIQCTNPTCKTSIPVLEGTSYVVCPVCNTWHFPSDFDNATSGSSGYDSIDYVMPSDLSAEPISPLASEAPKNSSYPHYPTEEGAVLPTYAPTFHQKKEPEKEVTSTIGWFLLPDGQKLQLQPGRNIIGRKSNLSINDPTVSRKHCVVEVIPHPVDSEKWDYILSDIGEIEGKASMNGVFIIGRSLRLQNTEKIPINNGTVIRLGSVRLTLQCPS